MLEKELQDIADKAKMIVSGYAFSERDDGLISILNLNHHESTMVIKLDGEIVETNMGQPEQKTVREICRKNLHFMEEAE